MLSTTQFVNTTILDDDGDPSSVDPESVDKTSFGEGPTVAQMIVVTATLEGANTEVRNSTVVLTLRRHRDPGIP